MCLLSSSEWKSAAALSAWIWISYLENILALVSEAEIGFLP